MKPQAVLDTLLAAAIGIALAAALVTWWGA